jgi:hypothetical protein
MGLLLVAAAAIAVAQDQPPAPPQTQNPPAGAWRRFSEPAPAAPDPEPVERVGEPAPPRPANDPPRYGLPAELTVKPGTFVTVRIDDMLSSNRNHPDDAFSAVLAQPLVVDGVVVAERGQTVYGRVAQALKSHAGNPSVLALELTGLTLVDGTQAPLRSQLVARQGAVTPPGQQAGTVIGATALGAAIGAIAGRGEGAGIGAGAGLAAGSIAALETRNHPTVVYPETALTFRIDSPLAISTVHAPQAFRYINPSEYNLPAPVRTRIAVPAQRPYYGPYYNPYYGSYPYGYWGPSFGVMIGRGGFRRR